METPRLLACAVARRRVAYVFLVGARVRDWRVSEKAWISEVLAAEAAQTWINDLSPEVLVTEKIGEASRKSAHTQAISRAIARTAGYNFLLDVSTPRRHLFRNKYEEAEALAVHHPEIAAWLPRKRRYFDHEPRNIVLFEALSLARTVLDDPSTSLAKAMG